MLCLRPRNNDRSFVRRLSLVSIVECRRLSSDGVMARVGSCDAAPLSASRASSYVPSLLPPAPPIWTVHGTLSPSYAVGGALYGGLPGPTPTVVSLSDTRPTTTSLGSQSPAQHAYYEITVSWKTHESLDSSGRHHLQESTNAWASAGRGTATYMSGSM